MARDPLKDDFQNLFEAALSDPSVDESGGAKPRKRSMPAANAPSGMPKATQDSIPAMKGRTGNTIPPGAMTAPPPSPKKSGNTIVPEAAAPPPKKAAPGDSGSTPQVPKRSGNTIVPESGPSVPKKSASTIMRGASAASIRGVAIGSAPTTNSGPSAPEPPATRQPMPSPSSSPASGPIPSSKMGASPSQPGNTRTTKPPLPMSPLGSKKSAPAANPGHARKNLEMIDYAPDEPLIDHKGRSRPMYKASTPHRPRSWRPSKPIRLMLGLFPGMRVMALENVASGLPYTILGLLSIIPTLFLLIGWSRTANDVRTLMIDERWLLAHGVAVLVLVIVFEMLRLASFFEEEKVKGMRVPRILAALAAPAVVILVAGPDFVALWPRLVEAAWFAAFVVSVGAIAGVVWCAFAGTLATPKAIKVFRVTGAVVIVLLAAAAFLTQTFTSQTLSTIASVAQSAGFQTLPQILRSLV